MIALTHALPDLTMNSFPKRNHTLANAARKSPCFKSSLFEDPSFSFDSKELYRNLGEFVSLGILPTQAIWFVGLKLLGVLHSVLVLLEENFHSLKPLCAFSFFLFWHQNTHWSKCLWFTSRIQHDMPLQILCLFCSYILKIERIKEAIAEKLKVTMVAWPWPWPCTACVPSGKPCVARLLGCRLVIPTFANRPAASRSRIL